MPEAWKTVSDAKFFIGNHKGKINQRRPKLKNSKGII
jgi:hypothetical protein